MPGALSDVARSSATPGRATTRRAPVSCSLPSSCAFRLLYSARRPVPHRNRTSLLARAQRCVRHQRRADPPELRRPDRHLGAPWFRHPEIPRTQGHVS